MRLVFHGILVGRTGQDELGIAAEMSTDTNDESVTALELVDGHAPLRGDLLDVYDVILAGVEYAE